MLAHVEYEEYRDLVHAVIVDYQYMEEGLRGYLGTTYRLIREKVDGAVPFTYEYDDNDKESLGTLVSKFEKLNGNATLIKELKDLVPSRNAVAHRAFLLTSKQHDDAEHLKKLSASMRKLKMRTGDCVVALFDEIRNVENKRKKSA